MKILRKLIASTLAFALVSSVAVTGFAMSDAKTASYKVTSKVSDVYKSDDKNYVDVSFYVGKVSGSGLVKFESFGGCTVNFKTKFNPNNVSYTNGDWDTDYTASKSSVSEAYKATGTLNFSIANYGDAISFDPSKALFKLKFEVKQTTEGSYDIFSAVTEVAMADDGDNKISSKANTSNMDASAVTAAKYEIKAASKVTTGTSAKGATTVTYSDDYTGERNLDGKYIVFMNANLQGTDVTKDTRFDITYDGTTKTFGATLFETLGMTGSGTLKAESYRFGVAFGTDVAPSDVSIEVK